MLCLQYVLCGPVGPGGTVSCAGLSLACFWFASSDLFSPFLVFSFSPRLILYSFFLSDFCFLFLSRSLLDTDGVFAPADCCYTLSLIFLFCISVHSSFPILSFSCCSFSQKETAKSRSAPFSSHSHDTRGSFASKSKQQDAPQKGAGGKGSFNTFCACTTRPSLAENS